MGAVPLSFMQQHPTTALIQHAAPAYLGLAGRGAAGAHRADGDFWPRLIRDPPYALRRGRAQGDATGR